MATGVELLAAGHIADGMDALDIGVLQPVGADEPCVVQLDTAVLETEVHIGLAPDRPQHAVEIADAAPVTQPQRQRAVTFEAQRGRPRSRY